MNLINYFKSEIKFYNKFERFFYLFIIFCVCLISYMSNDSLIAVISSLCGITYTLFAGKGKVYCYYIGVAGTFFYCLICYKNGLYGNLGLYALYFLPLQILGIFSWKKNLNKEKNEIVKSKLNNIQRVMFGFLTILLTFFIYIIIKLSGASSPLLDSVVTGFSILGQYLTFKRCIEQWIVWFLVNFAAVIMWFNIYTINKQYASTLIMWLVYLILAVYFFIKWKNEISKQ